MRGLILVGDGEMMRVVKVLFKKIDGAHIDVGVRGDFVRCKCLCSIDRGVLA